MQSAVVMVLAGILASQYHGRAWRHVIFVASSRVEARTLAGASPQQTESLTAAGDNCTQISELFKSKDRSQLRAKGWQHGYTSTTT